MNYPLLPVAAALAAGILAATGRNYFFLTRTESLLAASAATALACVALWLRRDRLAFAAAMPGLFLIGAFYLSQEQQVRSPRDLETLVASGAADLEEPMRLTG